MQRNPQNTGSKELLARIDQVIELIDDLRRERSGDEIRSARFRLGAVHARARLNRLDRRNGMQKAAG
ncbi:hypothetical protein [Microvirga massiliensis]|uniref:hypothetical protein n=1 Tax=Microvirga massiliensis TaxID=1033741 RepID=UPI00062BB9AF|nr:hypothetical protein [Microvirga massiliensis]